MMSDNRNQQLFEALQKRILILDGAMGTMLQSFHFTEEDFRGKIFADHPVNLKGDNDVLNLTQPAAVLSVHTKYLEAGADIIETNSFNANVFSQADYGLSDRAYDLNRAAAAIARSAADSFTEQNPEKPRFVAGSMGPTGKTLSMSPSVSDPAYRELTFSQLAEAYETAACGLVDGGADILLIETIFDTLNAKAAICGINEMKRKRGLHTPVMISGTLSDASGRLLSGQNVEAFLISVQHCPDLLSIGLNCALGAAEMRPYIAELARKAPCRISAHPNAGLPDEQGHYKQTPEEMGRILQSFAEDGLLNIAGGCCGTNPDHIRAIAESLNGMEPRKAIVPAPALRLSGLDPLVTNPELPFLNVGERTNVAGSRKFLRLIREGKADEAVQIARNQVENGACIIDVNMDDAMLDAKAELSKFLLRLAGEPDIARVPVMIDSSRWDTILAGLSCVQGKCVVNSISLKEGEEIFLEHARQARQFGAALLCMAFDEHGQADTLERRIAVCRRMFDLLTKRAGVPPCDIIFDVNVFAVATGLPEHDSYAKDFIEAVRILKAEMPDCHFSGGISNVSFSFRGNEPVRAALHSVFLYHAIKAGLDMGIVNPAQLAQYEELDPELRAAAEAVILNSSPDAGSKLLEIASGFAGEKTGTDTGKTPEWRLATIEERIQHALIHGDDAFLKDDIAEALTKYSNPVKIIEGPLMQGMNEVGVRFGAGKMFLPQVVKTARVMKNAVSYLMPSIQAAGTASGAAARQPVMVLATVKGDVHDIGKNIVAVVLQCNHFKVIDLGVMVPCNTIVETAIREHADIVALSGLITPSLEEMGIVADELERRGFRIPLMVGGAAASRVHTALKLQPRYPSGIVAYTSDASQCAPVAMALADPAKRERKIAELKAEYETIRREHESGERKGTMLSFAEAERLAAERISEPSATPGTPKIELVELDAETVSQAINWNMFLNTWDLNGSAAAKFAGADLLNDAKKLLKQMLSEKVFQPSAVFGLFAAGKSARGIELYADETRSKVTAFLPMLRRQRLEEPDGLPLSAADLLNGTGDHLGMFAVTVGKNAVARATQFRAENDDYSALILQSLAGCMAEASAEVLHREIASELWGFDPAGKGGIRPAIGYPMCPDHTLKRDVFRLLDAEKRLGVTLTENMMMDPPSSVCALFFASPEAHYFAVGEIGDDQLAEYAKLRGMNADDLKRFIL